MWPFNSCVFSYHDHGCRAPGWPCSSLWLCRCMYSHMHTTSCCSSGMTTLITTSTVTWVSPMPGTNLGIWGVPSRSVCEIKGGRSSVKHNSGCVVLCLTELLPPFTNLGMCINIYYIKVNIFLEFDSYMCQNFINWLNDSSLQNQRLILRVKLGDLQDQCTMILKKVCKYLPCSMA